jgi:hypothetical protein
LNKKWKSAILNLSKENSVPIVFLCTGTSIPNGRVA